LALASDNSNEKGKLFEDVAEIMLESPYLESIGRNVRNKTGEFDVYFAVKKIPGTLFQDFSDNMLVECKNWAQPVSAAAVRVLKDKMEEVDCKVGLLVTKMGVTGQTADKDARGIIKNAWIGKDRLIIIWIDMQTIDNIVDGRSNLYDVLMEKYHQIKMHNP